MKRVSKQREPTPEWALSPRLYDCCCGDKPEIKDTAQGLEVCCRACGDTVIEPDPVDAVTQWNRRKRGFA